MNEIALEVAKALFIAANPDVMNERSSAMKCIRMGRVFAQEWFDSLRELDQQRQQRINEELRARS